MPTTTRRFTIDDFKTMTEAQVIAFWRDRQRSNRGAGLHHYTHLVDPKTDEVVATIDDTEA